MASRVIHRTGLSTNRPPVTNDRVYGPARASAASAPRRRDRRRPGLRRLVLPAPARPAGRRPRRRDRGARRVHRHAGRDRPRSACGAAGGPGLPGGGAAAGGRARARRREAGGGAGFRARRAQLVRGPVRPGAGAPDRAAVGARWPIRSPVRARPAGRGPALGPAARSASVGGPSGGPARRHPVVRRAQRRWGPGTASASARARCRGGTGGRRG
jgi:hypothetical protein